MNSVLLHLKEVSAKWRIASATAYCRPRSPQQAKALRRQVTYKAQSGCSKSHPASCSARHCASLLFFEVTCECVWAL